LPYKPSHGVLTEENSLIFKNADILPEIKEHFSLILSEFLNVPLSQPFNLLRCALMEEISVKLKLVKFT
ncbi:hypothetical protein, partial [Lysinibacillus composti]|uniref:hypothetical protein n=1 Tax=Lysinibacillus composti TaxID=720633 RepID=UPI001960DA44